MPETKLGCVCPPFARSAQCSRRVGDRTVCARLAAVAAAQWEAVSYRHYRAPRRAQKNTKHKSHMTLLVSAVLVRIANITVIL